MRRALGNRASDAGLRRVAILMLRRGDAVKFVAHVLGISEATIADWKSKAGL